MNTDSDGIVHLKGAVDTKRRTIDPLHSAFGYTSQDVTDLRSHLSAIGIKLSWDDVEALLLEAQHSGIKGSSGMPVGTKRAKWREQRAARRQWAREHGICVICTKNAAGYRESDGSQMATCRDCQVRSNAAKKRGPKTA